jgi:hypothetical protein
MSLFSVFVGVYFLDESHFCVKIDLAASLESSVKEWLTRNYKSTEVTKMNSKINSAFLTLFAFGVFNLVTINIFAQKTDSMKIEQPLKQCSGEKFVMPQSIAVDNEAFANFVKVMSLPGGKRQKTFSAISNEEKANVYRGKLALEFTKRPNLSKEQKSLILDAISAISADTYNQENPELAAKAQKQTEEIEQRAASIFPRDEAFKIFEGLNGDKTVDVAFLRKYEEKLALPMQIRRKTIREASPAEKSDFWKAQMVYHLATAKLSKVQLEFIVDMIPLLKINAFDLPKVSGQPENEETKAIKALEPKILELFSKEEAFAIFMGVGIHKEVLADSNFELARPFECDCINWCGPSQLCGTPECAHSQAGCGLMGFSSCIYYCIN